MGLSAHAQEYQISMRALKKLMDKLVKQCFYLVKPINVQVHKNKIFFCSSHAMIGTVR